MTITEENPKTTTIYESFDFEWEKYLPEVPKRFVKGGRIEAIVCPCSCQRRGIHYEIVYAHNNKNGTITLKIKPLGAFEITTR